MNERALIVDDQPEKLEKLMPALLDAGIDKNQIDIASDIATARELLRETTYELLLLDLALPETLGETPIEMGGIDLLTEIYESGNLNVPEHVVAISAHDELRTVFESRFSDRLVLFLHCDLRSTDWLSSISKYAASILKTRKADTKIGFSTDVCIITALRDPELTAFRDLADYHFGDLTICNRDIAYVSGTLATTKGTKLSVCASASLRMGPVNSALHAARLISQFRPRILILGGICAGVLGRSNIGDPVLMTPVWDWQAGKYFLSEEAQAARGGRTKASQTRFVLDPHHLEVGTLVETQFGLLSDRADLWTNMWNKWRGPKPASPPTPRTGPVASGSSVIASAPMMSEIQSRNARKLVGVEMEGYGVYSAAQSASDPRPLFLGVKAICDLGDASKSDTYQTYAAHISASTILRLLESSGEALVSGQP